MILKADKPENQGEGRYDWLKWLIALMLMFAGLAANHYYSGVSLPIRLSIGGVIIAIIGFTVSKTQKGRWLIKFFQDSRSELRKVVWPTREETMQTTLVVAAMVIVLALILWGMDSILLWLIGWLTGQRG